MTFGGDAEFVRSLRAPISSAAESIRLVCFVNAHTESGEATYRTILVSRSKQATLDQLDGVFARCSGENWDGYSAAPVTPEAYQKAKQLILSLPANLPLPEVSAEPDGHVALEWYRSPRHTLSVSVSPSAELHYAALLPGPSKAYGTEPFSGDVPRRILELIKGAFTA